MASSILKIKNVWDISFNLKRIIRSSHHRCSMKKGVLRNLTKSTGKHLCQSLFLNKVAGLRPASSLKKRLWHRCFPANFVKFLKTPFLTEHLRCLLLHWRVLFPEVSWKPICISWKVPGYQNFLYWNLSCSIQI